MVISGYVSLTDRLTDYLFVDVSKDNGLIGINAFDFDYWQCLSHLYY